jgi:lipopolysaccharide biosynthesis regulator YciM
MPADYFLIFLFLLIVVVGVYAVFTRYFKPQERPNDRTYVSALRDLLDGRQEKAFAKLRQVVAEDSTNIDAYLRLGQILREHNKPEQALQVHRDLTLRGGLEPTQKSSILQQLTLDYMALKDYDTAEAALKELIDISRDHRWAHSRLLDVQKHAGKWDDAYHTAVTILKLDSDKSKKPLAVYKLHMAEDLHKKREYHKARVLYKEAIGLDPGCVKAYIGIGDSYEAEGRQEDAVTFWTKLIDAAPDSAHLVIERLKRVLYELGRFGDLGDICQNILKHSPGNREATLALSDFYEKKGDGAAAEELLNQYLEDRPEDLRAIVTLLKIYAARNDRRRIDELLRMVEHRLSRPLKAAPETPITA